MSPDPTLITGVGKRAGFHIARAFLQRGMPVIGTFRTRYESLGGLEQMGAELYRCDFEKRSEVEELIEKIRTRHTSLRGVIHNASDWLSDDASSPADQIIEKMMRVHAHVPYVINQALTPLLLACRSSHADIVHIGDYVSSRGSTKHIAYAASKAAQDNLTLSFAAKLAPKVKVNSLAPALIVFNEDDDESYREKAIKKNLMGREGGLEELQHAVDYLFDSRYVTGRILPVDGGRHLR